jgi:hypothetical protein
LQSKKVTCPVLIRRNDAPLVMCDDTPLQARALRSRCTFLPPHSSQLSTRRTLHVQLTNLLLFRILYENANPRLNNMHTGWLHVGPVTIFDGMSHAK